MSGSQMGRLKQLGSVRWGWWY